MKTNRQLKQGHNMRQYLLSGLAVSAMAFSISSSTALAQTSNGPGGDEIVVTGTNIRGTEVVGGAVLTISQEELAQSGRTTAADFLRELPSNLAGGVGISDEVQSGQDAGAARANLTGGQGVNLRGLGALSTLVLVNGRRQATSGQFGDFVDISTIPTAAIERMEILQDGASAIYGSDAVGGVVNFILKRQIDAPVTSFRVGTATEGGGTEILASHVHGLNWDGGHAVIGGEYRKRDAVAATERDRYSQGSDYSRFGGINWPEYALHLAPTANIFIGAGGATNSAVGASVPVGTNASLDNADLIVHTDGSGNTYNIFEGLDLLPEVERYSVFGSLDQELSETVSFFADARYTRRESDYNLGYSLIAGHSLSPNSPFYIANIDPALTTPDGSIAFGKILTDRVDTRESVVNHFSGEAGFRVDLFSDWAGEIVGSYSRDKQKRYREQLRNPSGNGDMLGCALGHASPGCAAVNPIPWNPFSTDPLSQAQIDQYYGFEDLRFDSKILQLSAKADGSVFALPAGAVKLAVGADYREETISGFLDFNTLTPSTQSGPYEETKRDAVSVFGELYIPLMAMVDVTVAGRYEKFSGTGDYDTFDPKVGVNFTPNESLKLRGSWGTSFHAPAMRFEDDSPQPLPGGNAAFVLPVSYRAPCDTTLVSLNGLAGTPGAAGQQCTMSLIINSGGAGPGVLSPEQAETWTLGADFTPESIPGLKASISYFNIKVDDRIQRIQAGTLPAILAEFFATNGGGAFRKALIVNPSVAEAQAILDSAKFLGTFGPPVANTAADIAIIVNATQLNIASLKEQGLDFSVSYDFSAGGADVGVFTTGTYLTKFALQDAPGNDFVNQLGKYSSFGAPVKLRAKTGIRAKKGNWDGRLTYNYVDNYECDACYVPGTGGVPTLSATPVQIKSWNTFDLDLGWDISDFGGLANGTRLNFQVVNLFNSAAPFLDGGSGVGDPLPSAYDPNNHTIIGRTVALQVTKTW